MNQTDANTASSLWRLIRLHPAVAASLLVAALSVVKLLTVAHGAPVTVASILGAQGFSGLASVAVVAGLPVLVAGLLASAVLDVMEALREEDALRGPAVTLAVALVLGFALLPRGWFQIGLFYLGYAVLSSLFIRYRRAWLLRRGRRLSFMLQNSPKARTPEFLLLFALALGIVFVTLSDQPWLPREQLTSRDGSTVDGYVLDDGGDFLHVLREDTRLVVVMRADNAERRALCAPSSGQRSWLAELVWRGEARYPDC